MRETGNGKRVSCGMYNASINDGSGERERAAIECECRETERTWLG